MPDPRAATTVVRTLAAIVAAVAYLYLLGRLKVLYYFDCFGIDWASLDIGGGELLFESWFPAQQLLFAALLGWLALKTRLLAVSLIAALYATLPIAAHYAFLTSPASGWSWLIDYRHSLLKFVPFATLIVLCAVPTWRRRLARRAPATHPAVRRVALIVLLSWGISTAKHSGAYDANRAVREPELLPRVAVEGGPEAYLLHAGPRSLILWDGLAPTSGGDLRTLELPRESVDGIERRKRFRVQPGGQYL